MIFWSRARVALAVCIGVAAALMLFEGLFQIGAYHSLPCPFFAGGCESVAMAQMSRPLGFASGLLYAALFGVAGVLVQLRQREAAWGLVAVAALSVGLFAWRIVQMRLFGATCAWCLLTALLTIAILALSIRAAAETIQAPAT